MTNTKKHLEIIFQMAWEIFNNDKKPIILKDTDISSEVKFQIKSGLLIETKNGVTFSNVKDLVAFAAQYFVNTNLSKLLENPNSCFEQLHEIYRNEIRQEVSVSGQSLALLHNAGHFDAFDWALKVIESEARAFDVFHVLEGAIAHFDNASAQPIINFVSGYYEKVKNDLVPGRILPEMDKWFSTHSQVAEEIMQLHLNEPNESTANIFRSALQGELLYEFKKGFSIIISYAQSENVFIAGPALHALGLIEFDVNSHSKELDEAVTICRAIIENPESPSLQSSVTTLGRLLKHDKAISEILIIAGKTKKPEALQPISEILFRNMPEHVEKEWFNTLLQFLVEVRTEDQYSLNNIDYIFSSWVKSEAHRNKVIEFIENWILKQDSKFLQNGVLETYFNGTAMEISNDEELLGHLVTKWLINDDRRYALTASKYISHLRIAGLSSISLDKSILDDLNIDDFRFLIRRILGYVSGDEILIPLLFSLNNTKDAISRTHPLINTVFLNHVSQDYPYDSAKYLKEMEAQASTDEETRELCAKIRQEIELYMEIIRSLPECKELQASHIKIRQIGKAHNKQMSEAFEEASKDSIWRQMTTHIHLKAGRRSFQKIGDKYTDPMELKPMSTEFTLPKSEITDPSGAARERLLFRQAKRSDA